MEKQKRATRSDGEKTRAKLLETALQLFSEKGFADTAGKEIAARADADLASINYHFGSKKGLYEETLIFAHHRIIDLEDLRKIQIRTDSAEDKLRDIISLLIHSARNGHMAELRLLVREFISPGQGYLGLIQREVMPKLSTVYIVISDITGIPAGDPALVCSFMSVFAPLFLALIFGGRLPGPLQHISEVSEKDLADHLTLFAIAGLRAVKEKRLAENSL